MIIKNADIYTMENREVIKNGFVEIENGKIVRVGSGVVEGNGEVIDARGMRLYPGFIDGHTHIGIIEDSIDFEGDDLNEMTDPCTPQLRAVDAINPMDRCFSEAVRAGVTCAAVSPGSANPIGGQICVLKTTGRRVDDMTVLEPAAMKFALGENPKNVYHGKNQAPETRMATAAIMREALMKAKKYLEAKEKYESSEDKEDLDEPEYDAKSEALCLVIKGEIPVHFHAHRADDIFTAIRIAREFGLKYTIVHCTEGRLVSDILAKEKITAFVGPNLCDRSKPELRELSYENPKVMSEAGVLIGLTTDHPVIPLEYLPVCAALAVRAGMDEYDALRAITINPAVILGLGDRLGSIRAGKDADMSLFEGDPLTLDARAKAVFINGKLVYSAL